MLPTAAKDTIHQERKKDKRNAKSTAALEGLNNGPRTGFTFERSSVKELKNSKWHSFSTVQIMFHDKPELAMSSPTIVEPATERQHKAECVTLTLRPIASQ